MKNLAVLCSLLSLVMVQTRIYRLPHAEVPAFTCTYLFVQAVFTFIGLLALHGVGFQSKAYQQIFFGCLWGSLGLSVALTFCLAKQLPAQSMCVVLLMGLAIGFGVPFIAVHSLKLHGMMGAPQVKQFAACGIFLFCGFVSLLALFYPAGKVTDLLRMFLGCFWLAQAFYGFFCPLVAIRNRSVLIAYTDFIPSLVAIIVFSWLTWTLGKGQIELSRQHDQSIIDFSLAEDLRAEYVQAQAQERT
jgi:hypothetical protein